MLQLSFFHTFRVRLNEQPVTTFKIGKVQCLLVYLLCNAGKRQSRPALAALLWPDSSETAAFQNLRTTLHRLRKTIQQQETLTPHILSTREYISWNVDVPYESDIERFRQHIAAVRPLPKSAQLADPRALEHIQAAIDLYKGEFLQGVYTDSAEFDNWLAEIRESLHEQVMWALNLGVEQAERSGNYGQAVHYARRQLEYEAWRESAHRQLMRAYFEQGELEQAMEQYSHCLFVLENELGVQPSDATRQLYEHIHARYLQPTLQQENPFRGLHAFTEEDANYFFGREMFTSQLMQAVYEQSWVAVIGASGSGKSSVVHAGVLPQLHYLGRWKIIKMRPGERPLSTLSESIGISADAELQNETFTAALEGEQPVLLVIDAFEELYTLCTLPEKRQQFIDLLVHATHHTDLDLTVLFTMRADFVGQAVESRALVDILQTGAFFLGPMNEVEMRRVIEEPVTLHQAGFEAGLVTRLLHDVGEEVGGLPLLEFTLTLLWEQMENGRLTHQNYESIGRVRGALVQHADGVIASLSPEELETAQRVLVQMVQLGEQTDDTRRQVTRSELHTDGSKLVQKLADARLVVTGRTVEGEETAEIAHEILIRQWPALRGWMNADRLFRTWKQRLRTARKQWEYSKEDEGALLRGGLLVEAGEWYETRLDNLTVAERNFIESSLILRQCEKEVVKAQQQRELEQAQALIAVERRRAEEAAENNIRLQRQVDLSQSMSLAANAQLALIEKNSDLALTLAMEANRITDPPEQARHMLNAAAYRRGTRHILEGHNAPVLDVVVSKNGRFALSSSADNMLIGWDLINGRQTHTLAGHQGAVCTVKLMADDQQAISAATDCTIKRWNLATAQCLHTYTCESDPLSIAVSPDEQQLWVGCKNGRLYIWNLHTHELITTLTEHEGQVSSLAISPDGKTAVSGGEDRNLIFWNTADYTIQHRIAGQRQDLEDLSFTGHVSNISGIHFSSQIDKLITFGERYTLAFWDILSEEVLWTHLFDQDVYGTDWSANGRYAVASQLDGHIAVIDLWHGREAYTLYGHTGRANAVCFTPDGRQLVSASDDGTVRVWDTYHGQILRQLHVGPDISQIAFSVAITDDGKTCLSGEFGGAIRVWDYDTGELIRYLNGHTESIFPRTYFLPDGKTAVSAALNIYAHHSEDRAVRVWNWQTGEEIAKFNEHDHKIWQITLSPDGQWVASSCHDGKLRLWNVTNGEMRMLHDFSPQAPRTTAFSPDGTQIAVGLAKGMSSTPDYSIRLLSIATGEEIRRLEGHNEVVADLTFTADGKMLISGSFDTQVILWDSITGALRRILRGHRKGILCVTIHQNGRLLATGGHDTIILWDLHTGKQLRHLPPLYDTVFQLLFHPNGRTLLSVASDSMVTEWEIDDSPCVSMEWIAANRVVIPFTEVQKASYLTPMSEE